MRLVMTIDTLYLFEPFMLLMNELDIRESFGYNIVKYYFKDHPNASLLLSVDEVCNDSWYVDIDSCCGVIPTNTKSITEIFKDKSILVNNFKEVYNKCFT